MYSPDHFNKVYGIISHGIFIPSLLNAKAGEVSPT
jgi:hypothetical protein